ncbi:MAG: hypothetical protein CMH83_08230 [Nocardioides sp.]|nr:hypothetical protein [Nocardioides sp.]
MSYDAPPPPPAPGYGAPYGAPAQNSGKAIASLVTGLVGLLTVCCGFFVVSGIVGIVLGFLARKDIDASQGQLKGAGMAMAGIILGFVEVALFAISIILVLTGVIDLNYSSDFG